ncbi:RNA polymerase sigma-70 factor [Pedobacter sp. MC2016-14]|uniref:RNA polymerase sigma factor n=1 Tax=Pedobacter sp. MC2016-14 TaxID=2897327 RepID=UPI001E5F276F|nr:RNA polymerase sigma-70 factor [Pedobacter sp. MC2016-14]MCD0488963.1 RNA polymerase sigma-70 factor [Pedobacter sp. MC2016-14]
MQEYSQLSDTELTVFLKGGDKNAYAEIYDRYWAVLYRYSRRLLQSEKEAEDVVQDIFVMLWSKSDDLELKVSLSAFLYASVRNRILKHFEKSKVRKNYINSLGNFMDNGTCITDHLARERELAARIEYEVSMLPEKMREVFKYTQKGNLSYKEIAEELGISENTVRKQRNNAVNLLKVKFGDLLSIALTFL